MMKLLIICCGNAPKHTIIYTRNGQKISGDVYNIKLDEKTFILGIFPKTTLFVIQFLMLVAKYYINMNRSSKKHLNFLESINVYSLFLSHRETALKINKLQEI